MEFFFSSSCCTERLFFFSRRKRKRIILGYVVTTMCLDGLRSKVRTGGYTRDTLDTERKAQGVQDETYYNTRSRVEAEGGRLAPDLPVDTRRKEKEVIIFLCFFFFFL